MTGRAFFSAISGLRSNQTRLDVVANNIANLNTFGFKSSRVTFSDLLSQSIRAAASPQGERGGINPLQVGLGVQIASIDNIMSQGSIQNTGNIRDLAIDGDGFFIMEGEQGQVYSRAGNLTIDFTGRLVNVNGLRVQGFGQLTQDGTQIDPSSPLGDIFINFGQKIPARSTSLVTYRSNLDAASDTFGSSELVSAGSTGFTLATGIASPLASFRGTAIGTAVIPDSTPGDLLLNGTDINITWPTTPPWVFTDPIANAQFVADAINAQSPNVYARVVGNGQLELESLFGNGSDLIVGGTGAFLTSLGLAAGTYTEPVQSSAEAGTYTITVREATAATSTTQKPVPAGLIAAGSITLNNVAVSFGPTSSANTAAQNAQVIADAINLVSGTTFVSAIANANGTLSLTATIAGENNVITVDSVLSGAQALSDSGLDTIGLLSNFPPPPAANPSYTVQNGTDAFVTADFESDDGLITRSRTFEDSPAFGSPSGLSNLEAFILGDNPPKPLIPGVTLTAEMLANGQARVKTADAFTHAATVNVFDSLGNAHQMVVEFQHFDQNQWTWTATLPAEPNITLANNTGVLDFGQDGLVSSPNPLTPVSFTPPGADAVAIELNFDGTGNPLEGITQFSGSSTTRANFQDGFALGVLQTFAFDINGVIQGSFSNGLTRPIAQVALANFNNPAGLLRVGQNTWSASANSGTVSINRPGTGGAGNIVPGALEQSNVDLASEFTDLIIGQRGFQANTRVITTQDQILGEVVNLVR